MLSGKNLLQQTRCVIVCVLRVLSSREKEKKATWNLIWLSTKPLQPELQNPIISFNDLPLYSVDEKSQWGKLFWTQEVMYKFYSF